VKRSREQRVVGTALSSHSDAPLRLVRQNAASTVIRVQGFPSVRFMAMVLWLVTSMASLVAMMLLMGIWPLVVSAALGVLVLLVGLALPVADLEITLGATALSYTRFRSRRILWTDIDEVRVDEIGFAHWRGLARQDLVVHLRDGGTARLPIWVKDPERTPAQVNASARQQARALNQGHLEWLADQMNARVMAMKRGAVPEAMDALRSAERPARTARSRRRERE
jgi:hypothetical protein